MYKTLTAILLIALAVAGIQTVQAITQSNTGTQTGSQSSTQSGGVNTNNQIQTHKFSFNNNGVITSGCTKTVNGVSSPC